MYVDGLLVENDTPDATLLAQPDMPGATTLTALGATRPGIYVAYLDVWERLITALDNPAIRESALGGPDTSVRTKLVWQLKLAFLEAAPGSGASLPSCASAGEPWLPAAASTGTLAAGSAGPGASMPCTLPPETGYQRLENQLYRVEIHQPGPDGTATFKWSRENGSVVALISAPPTTGGAAPPTTVTGPTFWVTSLSDDATLGLQAGDWVELTDDSSELTVGHGPLYQVATTPSDGQHVTITAATAPTATLSLHPKLRRWDQSGTGLDQGITVTTAAPILLEGGVQVQFSAGMYQTGDYWLIPARTATSVQQGFVEWPVDASFNPVAQPPLGIKHHYAKLGTGRAHRGGDPRRPRDRHGPDGLPAAVPAADRPDQRRLLHRGRRAVGLPRRNLAAIPARHLREQGTDHRLPGAGHLHAPGATRPRPGTRRNHPAGLPGRGRLAGPKRARG